MCSSSRLKLATLLCLKIDKTKGWKYSVEMVLNNKNWQQHKSSAQWMRSAAGTRMNRQIGSLDYLVNSRQVNAAEQKKKWKCTETNTGKRQNEIDSKKEWKWYDEKMYSLLKARVRRGESREGGRTREGGRSAVLSNVSCQFSLCLQLKLLHRSKEAVIG